MDDRVASRTAVLMCQARAVAHGRLAVGRFDDPTAWPMLRPGRERDVVEAARRGVAPEVAGDRMRYEMLRASGELAAPRTVAIDDGIRGRTNPQVVILGAGLDGRAWRMSELSQARVFEVDHPVSQRDKRDRVDRLDPTAGALTFVPVDFTRDSLDEALAGAAHDGDRPTTWVWEGVIPYLTVADVGATLRVVSARSAPGSRLIVNYQSPSLRAKAGRLAARALYTLNRGEDPLRDEPWRSTWTSAAMADLLIRHGWTVVEDRDVVTIAGDIGMEVGRRRSLASGRVGVADR